MSNTQQPAGQSYLYHKPSESGLKATNELRKAFANLHEQVLALAPHSRERSVALTELETSAMWAIKAIVVNDPDSEAIPTT